MLEAALDDETGSIMTDDSARKDGAAAAVERVEEDRLDVMACNC